MLNSINIPTAAMKRLLIFDYRCSVCWGPLITDGEDGLLRVLTEEGFLDQSGIWRVQARIVLATGEWYSDSVAFTVASNLCREPPNEA